MALENFDTCGGRTQISNPEQVCCGPVPRKSTVQISVSFSAKTDITSNRMTWWWRTLSRKTKLDRGNIFQSDRNQCHVSPFPGPIPRRFPRYYLFLENNFYVFYRSNAHLSLVQVYGKTWMIKWAAQQAEVSHGPEHHQQSSQLVSNYSNFILTPN